MQEGLVPYVWLIPGVLAGGPHPERHDRHGLARLHGTFDAVLSVFEEPLTKRTLEPWGPRYLWLKTYDGDPPDLAAAVAFIERAAAEEVATLVHCFAGIGRTGTVLGAWLLHRGECTTAVEARARVRRDYHPDAIESDAQLEGLAVFARRLRR